MAPRILYVEDTRAFQRMITRLIGDLAEIVPAEDATAALGLLDREKFDLVLSDFVFPNGDAMPLLLRIRERFTPRELPIVMLTSAADRISISNYHQAGANLTVKKPPETARLREVLQRMLREPWVEQPEFVWPDFQLLQWSSPGRAFVFCANLQCQTEADTPEEAMRLMREKLDAAARTLPAITTPKLSSYNPASRLNRAGGGANAAASGPVPAPETPAVVV